MKRWMGAAILIGALAILTAGDVIDRIAAVVNDEVILLSEVDEKLFILDSQGQLAGKDSSEVYQVRRDILDRLIEERLVVQRARSQGITVDAAGGDGASRCRPRAGEVPVPQRGSVSGRAAQGRDQHHHASRALRERRAAGASRPEDRGPRDPGKGGGDRRRGAQVLRRAQGRAAAETGRGPSGSRRGLSDRSRHGPRGARAHRGRAQAAGRGRGVRDGGGRPLGGRDPHARRAPR